MGGEIACTGVPVLVRRPRERSLGASAARLLRARRIVTETVTEPEPLFPLFLRLTDRPVLVVGAGKLGTEKIRELLAARARVTVVATEPSDDVFTWAREGRIVLHQRPFEDEDVARERPILAFATTGVPTVHARVFAAAEAARIFVVALDAPTYGSAFFGSIQRRPPFLIAISSHGEMPALTRLLREVLELALPPDHIVERARALRRAWKAEGTPMGSRFELLVSELVRSRTP